MSHRQIIPEERYLIQDYRAQGLCPAKIGEKLDRHRSTIVREVRRNARPDGVYIGYVAQHHANGRRSRCRRGPRYSEGQWDLIRHFIQEEWSPEQVSLAFGHYDVLQISHETIYRHIWRDKKNGGQLYRHLRQSPKLRRKRHRTNDSRGVLRGKRGLAERPEAANSRLEKGHFEVDLMHSAKSRDCLLTLVDRKTRLVFIRKLKDKSMSEVNRALIQAIRQLEIKTVTSDNGPEFHDYKSIEEATGVTFYFAAPYHSWERGTSENTNGLIRQYVPKQMSIAGIRQWECTYIEQKLNSRPRKILGLLTPEEAHYGENGFCCIR